MSKIRGAHHIADRDVPIVQTYAAGKRDILFSAKLEIAPAQYEDFLEWIDLQEKTLLGDVQGAKKGYEQLSGVAASKPSDLAVELRWTSALLARKSSEISHFRTLVDAIERSVVSDEFDEALIKLTEVDNFGVSLWSVQMRIALTHERSGLEAQKKLASEIQEVHKRGLLGFVAYYCSVRNESRTTANRYTNNTNKRIEAHRYFSTAVKRYLRHILVGEVPSSASGLSDILRVAQSHHLIDTYEEFVAVAQGIVCSTDLKRYWPLVSSCLDELDGVVDFRLEKLRKRLAKDSMTDIEVQHPYKILNNILNNKPKRALREFTASIGAGKNPDVWDFIYTGWIVSSGKMKPHKERRISRRCVRYLGAIFNTADLFDPHDALIKISRNFGQLPFFVALRKYSEIVNSGSTLQEVDLTRVSLNSRRRGFEDLSGFMNPALSESFRAAAKQDHPASIFWISFFDGEFSSSEPREIYSLSSAMGSLMREEREDARLALSRLASSELNGATREFHNIASLQLARDNFDKSKAVEIIADACSEANFSPIWHRIESAVAGLSWSDYAGCKDPVLSAVTLHMLWTRDRSSKTASMLRFSVRHCLKTLGAGKPSEINLINNYTALGPMKYFLRHVCVPEIIDVSKAIRGSRQVLEERSKICHILTEIDPKQAKNYIAENTDIQQQLTLADGQMIVDSSRIFVETAQLKRWADRNLSEEYSRYRDLAELDIGNFRALDEVLAGIVNSQLQGHLQYVPESEADVLLMDILSKIKNEFLTNASFGLDFFLSKRIRHQSFIGSIRGPLEFSELITTRVDLFGEYKPNFIWVNKLAVSSPAPRSDLIKAFEVFAQKFDTALLDAKDRYFQVRTREAPNGLISLALTANIVELAKSMVPLDSSFDDFMNTAEALLWVGLEPALAVTRSYISEELKGKLTIAMDELRATVKSQIGSTNEFLAFDAEVGRRSNEVQVKLEEISGWFKRTNLDFADKVFDLYEAIQMSQKFALSCLPGFSPQLEIAPIESDVKVKAESLVFLHDLILIALQNAKDHSGLKNPKVCTMVTVNAAEGSLSIRVESEIRSSLRESAKKGADEKARMILEGKSAFRSRKEGGSGFFKLAAITSQSSKGKLDFGVSMLGQFYLDVQYSLLMSKQEVCT